MVDSDLSKVRTKRPKIAVSLSLDKRNIDFLKEDIKRAEQETGEEITLSSVFDHWLNEFIKAIKKRNEEEKRENETKKE